MKIRERLRKWLPEVAIVWGAALPISGFIFWGATRYTGSWKSGLLWAFLISVGGAVCVVVITRLYLSQKPEYWGEMAKGILILIGLFTVLYWMFAPSCPYCEDMNKIAAEVESLDEAVRLFSDGKTDWKEAVSETETRMEVLRKLVEKCQCPDESPDE